MCTSIIIYDRLNQTIIKLLKNKTKMWSQAESNRRPTACKAVALPAELWPLSIELVGLDGFEPSTSSLSEMRSNQLSYRPSILVTIQFE